MLDSKRYHKLGRVQQERHRGFIVWGNLATKAV